MKSFITIFTILILTLNTVLASSVLPMVSVESSSEETMHMTHLCQDHQAEQPPEKLPVLLSMQLCGMDICDCWNISTANISNEFVWLVAVLSESAAFSATAVSDIPYPFIPPHQKPPRSLSA